jgi:hypothetical protein
MDGRGIVRRSPWGLALVALLGLAGCVSAGRGWVREQLAPVQGQVSEVRDRVAGVEQRVGSLNPKVDRFLAQTEQLAARQGGTAELPPDRRLVVDGAAVPAGTTALTPAARQAIDAIVQRRGTVELPPDIRQGQLPRHLTEAQRAQLGRTLRAGPQVPLAVVAPGRDDESQAFAKELGALFHATGWAAQGVRVSQQGMRGIPPGLLFMYKSGDEAMFAPAVRLQNGFNAVGIAAQSRPQKGVPQGILALVVGPQPQ